MNKNNLKVYQVVYLDNRQYGHYITFGIFTDLKEALQMWQKQVDLIHKTTMNQYKPLYRIWEYELDNPDYKRRIK